MEKRELEFSTRLTREDVAGLVEALIEGLKDGHLKVQKSDDVLELEVPRVVDLKIEAEIDDERAEFEIEVSWLTNRAGSPDTVPEETFAGEAAKQSPAGRSAAEKGASGVKKAAPAKAAVRKTGLGKTAAGKTAGKSPSVSRSAKKTPGAAASASATAPGKKATKPKKTAVPKKEDA